MYRKERLDNGLRIVHHYMPERRSVSLGVWINVGSRNEAPKEKGIAHYLEHLVFKGTKKYSCRQIKESIEGLGGALNGFTTEELTCYLVKIPSSYLESALDILSEMVLNPSLPHPEIERERTVILEEIKMFKDLPQHYVYELLDELLWPNQSLGVPVIGTLDSVARIKREELFSFKRQFYTPQNIVISAAGQLEFKKLRKSVTKIFSAEKKHKENTFPPAKEKDSQPHLKIFRKNTEQTHLAMGFHSFKRSHPLRHALGLLHVVLGANMSSRLFNEVREKRGLAYEIGTQVERLQDTGAFLVHAGVDNRKIKESLNLILKELEKIKKELVSADELKRAKEFYLGQVMLALEDTLDHMLWIGESTVALDKTYSLEEIIKEVNKIKRQDLQRIARQIFKAEKINLALVGPVRDSHKKIYHQLHLS